MLYRTFCAQYDLPMCIVDLQTPPFTIGLAARPPSVRSCPDVRNLQHPLRGIGRRRKDRSGSRPGHAGPAIGALELRLDQHRLARKSSSLGWLFGQREQTGDVLKGLYVYGEVGRGKTMLMDLFFETSAVIRKRRVHFHEFMADVHERVHVYRQEIKNGEADEHDPILRTAAAIAEESWLLCFDEFHITDIADAMILGRLFTRLFELGVVVVATSNLPPSELYKDGLNRALFLPFIALLERQCVVVQLEARVDFRLEKLTGVPTGTYPPTGEPTPRSMRHGGVWRAHMPALLMS